MNASCRPRSQEAFTRLPDEVVPETVARPLSDEAEPKFPAEARRQPEDVVFRGADRLFHQALAYSEPMTPANRVVNTVLAARLVSIW